MRLSEYLDSLPWGGKSRFASAIGKSPSMLSQMSSGKTPVPLNIAQKIVRESDGAVTLLELIPKLRN